MRAVARRTRFARKILENTTTKKKGETKTLSLSLVVVVYVVSAKVALFARA